jgi:hypothetical protein
LFLETLLVSGGDIRSEIHCIKAGISILQVERFDEIVKTKTGHFILAGEQGSKRVQDVRVEMQTILYDGMRIACLTLKP